MIKRRNGAIPRKTYSARQRTLVADNTSVFSNKTTSITYTPFSVINCTIQPASGSDLKTLDEGFRNKEVYILRTETAVIAVDEGSPRLSDQIQFNGVSGLDWFDVIKVKNWSVGVIPHYEVIIVRQPNQT